MSNPSISGPGDGFFGPKNWDERMINSTGGALLKGDLVQIDESVIDATTKAQTTIEDPSTLGLEQGGKFGVLLEDIANGASGLVRFRGRVEAQTTGTPAVGVYITGANAANTMTATIAATFRVLGTVLVTGSAVPTLIEFDGLSKGVNHA
jgi:hypothetical protein